ncbi:hypothetical protein MWU61_18490 [Loktanella sp. F6476L]|uniref:hypothetical protein n=1 Tax=Loktanella sp. F6476L TaxID=2926405 RepID=UPI001FF538A2|nr:hypothetical protein [Loktanella sp. F6476L]MCK0122547.1 hypothetical protein [Loktanella sp. F6476L]
MINPLVLSLENIGRNPILSLENWNNIERILSKKDSRLITPVHIEADQIVRVLNDILNEYLMGCFEPVLSRAERHQLLKMADLLKNYSDLARKFKHTSFMPPNLPKQWYDDAMSTFRQIEEQIESRAKGGRPENIDDVHFVACCAALFSIIFERQPTETPEGVKPGTGTFACFLEAIEITCHSLIVDPETANFALPEEAKTGLFLKQNSPDKTRKRIGRALEYVAPNDGVLKSQNVDTKYWMAQRSFLKQMYFSPLSDV